MYQLKEIKTTAQGVIFCAETETVRFWIAHENMPHVNYHYGGTRLVSEGMGDAEVESLLWRLASYESSLKNRMIDNAIVDISAGGGIPATELPPGFVTSKVGGGRCIVRPHSASLSAILANPSHPRFASEAARILADIGEALNRMGGTVKLTPDFGRYGLLADMMYDYTPHVLGIAIAKGGCGGKSSYSATGVVAAAKAMEAYSGARLKVTLIGSHGAMGTGVTASYLGRENVDLAVCDVAYHHDAQPPSNGAALLPARFGQFTEVCLQRGGLIVATTVGNELVNSKWRQIPAGTVLLMAHNLSLPPRSAGVELAAQVHNRGVTMLPGQVLTLGGALTSRLEWFWRQANPRTRFPKPLAHTVVSSAVRRLVGQVTTAANGTMSPYAAMLRMCDADSGSNER